MFATLFTRPHTLARHYNAPFRESRASYLSFCKAQGYPRSSLQKIAWVLMVFSLSIDLGKSGRVTRKEVEFAVDHRIRFYRRKEPVKESKSSRLLFICTAIAWLRFLGDFEESPHNPSIFSSHIEDFAKFMRDERGLSPATITFRHDAVLRFFSSLDCNKNSLDGISIHDVDEYLAHNGRHGWSRRSLRTLAAALRSFFHYTQARGLSKDIAEAIEAPPLYAQEGLPLGPTWAQVQQLLGSISGDTVTDLRDRAIILLLAVYGLRAGEVSRLQLDDIDWVGDILHITRPKQRCHQQYPLQIEVGNAITRYLKEARPNSTHRSLFLTICAPFRPLSASSMTPIVHSRLVALGIELPRRGAHCLRHACASHLLDSGFSLKQIGDQLGHNNPETTRIYAKVDLNGLRQVAELDMEDLL
jgi:site-specific recombinase XerD